MTDPFSTFNESLSVDSFEFPEDAHVQEESENQGHEDDPTDQDSHAGEDGHADEEEHTTGEGNDHSEDDHSDDGHSNDNHSADTGHDDGHHDEHGDHSGDLMGHYLGKDHLIGHVQDQTYFEMPGGMGEENKIKIHIPNPLGYTDEKPMIAAPKGAEDFLGPVTFQPTKFVVVELLAAILVATVFVWLGKKVKNGDPPKGRLWNMLEAGVIYIRDEVAKPAIGNEDAKRYLPFLWTIFFFILTMNLMGMFPLLGTPTGNISITTSLALITFGIVLFSGMKKLGVAGFWMAQAPHVELPKALGIVLIPMIWAIEVFGLFIKHMVLAVRLFANMFAGHLVLAVFVGFIGVTWGQALAAGVIPASLGASVAIGLLEILVAFIQAYVFTFLSALFIGAAIHPH